MPVSCPNLERKKNLQPVAAELPPIRPITTRQNTSSTLAKADNAAAAPLQRPELERPSYMREVLSLQPKVEETLKREIDLFEINSAQAAKSLEALSEEKTIALRKHAEEIAVKNSWSVLATVSQYIAGSSAVFMGVATGGWAGAALIASGSLGLGNRVIHDTVGWQAVTAWFIKNQELQKSLAQKIEMGTFYLSLGLGLAGGMWAYHTGSLALAQGTSAYAAAADKIGKVVGTSTALSGTAANFGESYASKKVESLRADLKEIEAQIVAKNQDTSNLCSEAADLLEMDQNVTDAIAKLVTASDRQLNG